MATDFRASITDVKQDQHGKYFIGTTTNGLYQVDIITSVEEVPSSNSNFYLSQNYPNPFNPITKIKYSLPVSGIAQIKVYDILGQEIKMLLNSYKAAGNYEIEFDGSNLPSGVYFYKIITSNYSEIKKMILLK